jgi:hypothetical protein
MQFVSQSSKKIWKSYVLCMKLAQHVLMCVLSVKVHITKIETRKLIHGGPISCTKHMISIFFSTGLLPQNTFKIL